MKTVNKKYLWGVLGVLALFAPRGGSSSAGIPSPLPPLPEGLKKYHLAIRKRQLKYYDIFKRAAALYKLPLPMVLAVGHGEGSGKPTNVSTAGAMGLMQLMPATARGLGLVVNETIDQRKDPELNVFGGCKLLRQLLNKYKDWDKVLAAYNSGSPNTDKRQPYIKYIRSFIPLYQGF